MEMPSRRTSCSNTSSSSWITLWHSSTKLGRLTGIARWSFGTSPLNGGVNSGSYGSDGSQRTPVTFCTRRSVARPLSSHPIG